MKLVHLCLISCCMLVMTACKQQTTKETSVDELIGKPTPVICDLTKAKIDGIEISPVEFQIVLGKDVNIQTSEQKQWVALSPDSYTSLMSNNSEIYMQSRQFSSVVRYLTKCIEDHNAAAAKATTQATVTTSSQFGNTQTDKQNESLGIQDYDCRTKKFWQFWLPSCVE